MEVANTFSLFSLARRFHYLCHFFYCTYMVLLTKEWVNLLQNFLMRSAPGAYPIKHFGSKFVHFFCNFVISLLYTIFPIVLKRSTLYKKVSKFDHNLFIGKTDHLQHFRCIFSHSFSNLAISLLYTIFPVHWNGKVYKNMSVDIL